MNSAYWYIKISDTTLTITCSALTAARVGSRRKGPHYLAPRSEEGTNTVLAVALAFLLDQGDLPRIVQSVENLLGDTK